MLRFRGVRARCVHTTASNESRHEENQPERDQNTRPPVCTHPVEDCVEGFGVEQPFLQPRQGSLGVHLATLVEDVAVTLVLVAR